MKLLVLISCLVLWEERAEGGGLREEFTWTRISFSRQMSARAVKGSYAGSSLVFPGETAKPTQDAQDGEYIYQNNIPMGANVWKDKLFITVPRRRLGVVSTLNYVPLDSRNKHNVPLIPYPDYTTNAFEVSQSRENRFVSVYRVAVDACDRLWFVDTGLVELPGNATRLQPTTLFVVDLKTDRIIGRHVFQESVLRPSTNLADLTVDVTPETCSDAFAYVPDVGGYGLVVYDLRRDASWRVTHNYFYLENLAGEFRIGGIDFQWNDGVFSVALSDVKADGTRDAYFHSMAGTHLYRVSTRILKNETLATRSYHGNDFKVLGDRGEFAQTSASDMHKPSGVLFLGLVNQNALGCFNTNKGFRLASFDVVQRDDQKMIYPCDVKIYKNDVVFLTNTMPVFLYSNLNYDEVNFRVWIEAVDKAVEGTRCAA